VIILLLSYHTGVHGVMFVTALSEFDQKLFEENDVNRMVRSDVVM
jgi:hypothetical protein